MRLTDAQHRALAWAAAGGGVVGVAPPAADRCPPGWAHAGTVAWLVTAGLLERTGTEGAAITRRGRRVLERDHKRRRRAREGRR